MDAYLFMAGAVAAILAAIALIMVRENAKRKKMFLAMIRRQYGTVPEREYRFGELEGISHYYQKKPKGRYQLDDITWNDLDMDGIYRLVNSTLSSCGDDYLYFKLRNPVFSETELKKQEELVSFFQQHEKEREKIQMMLLEIGRSRYGSLADMLSAVEDASFISPVRHIAGDLLILLSFGLIFAAPSYGVAAFIILLCYNMTTYYTGKDRKNIELYLSCFDSLVRILRTVNKMEHVDWPQLKEQMENIKQGKKVFQSFSKKAFILGSSSQMDNSPLQVVIDYLRIMFHIDILIYNSMLKTVRKHEKSIFLLIDSIGELDAAIAVGSFRKMLPYWCSPVFDRNSSEIKAEDLYHPAIDHPVANTLTMQGPVLLTGTNASGKSTFLKSLAINAVLAQTLGTCVCSSYEAPYLKVMTSMALKDNLAEGESYFIVEIKSLKRILEESKKQEPLLCIVDEVLRGTNTIERIAASSQILRYLKGKSAFCLAATHDIELTYILEDCYKNYHFEEEVGEKEVFFSYQLKDGRANTRNAIRLLRLLDYPDEIVENAKAAAERFEEKGAWINE